MKYTIIQVNTNNYDKVYENNDLDAAERLLFTDIAHEINNWTQIKLNNNKDFPFDDIFKIRWNPFDFTNSDYVIIIILFQKRLQFLPKIFKIFDFFGHCLSLLINNIFKVFYIFTFSK